MELSKIHISSHKDGLHEKPCEFFKVNRYFSELTTDVDKARARYNLGIPDEFSLTWEAIAGKPDINTLLNTQKSSIVTLYHLDTLAYDLLTIRSNVFELLNLTQGITNAKLLEVERLWSDVARNSRDILALQGGGDTSLGTRLTTVELKVSNIESIIANLSPSTSYDDTELRGLITALTSELSIVSNDVSNIKSQLSADEVTGIYLNQQSLNVMESAGDLTILVYAVHSKLAEDENVTSTCQCNTTNASVAYWNNSTKKVIIAGAGNATLTFSYANKTTTLSVVVEAESIEPTINEVFYIGYSSSLSDIKTGTKYRKTSLNGIWNSTNIPKLSEDLQGGSTNFYIAVPSRYTTISVLAAGMPVAMLQMSSSSYFTDGDITLIPYKLSGINNYDTEFTINIS